MYKKGSKSQYVHVTHKQTSTTELQSPELEQAHTYIMCQGKYILFEIKLNSVQFFEKCKFNKDCRGKSMLILHL